MEKLNFSKLLEVMLGESEEDAIAATVEIELYDFIKERHLLRVVSCARHETVILWAVKTLFSVDVLIQSTFDYVFRHLNTLSIKAKAADLYLERKDLTLKNVMYLATKLKIEESALKAYNTFLFMDGKMTEDILFVLKGIKLEAVGEKATGLLRATPGITFHDLYLLVITAETSSVRHGAARMMFESPMIDSYWLGRIKRCTLIEMSIRKQAKLIYWS